MVGGGGNLINRSGEGSVGGGAGRIVGVVIGAIIIFASGMAAGNLFCMKRYGLTRGSAKKDAQNEEYYDDYDYDEQEKGGATPVTHASKPDGRGGNDDGFYTKPGEDYTVGDDDDYLTAVPVNRTSGDSFPDIFGSSSSIGSRGSDSSDFSGIFGDKGRSDNQHRSRNGFSDDDEYPALFASGRPKQTQRQAPAAPTFDTGEDTIFGRFSANVERNIDDGYGGLSSSRSRDRSERSPRNR